eukprot:Pgem_evm1s101
MEVCDTNFEGNANQHSSNNDTNTSKSNKNATKTRKIRRCKKDMELKVQCDFPGCDKVYGSKQGARLHQKIKHSGGKNLFKAFDFINSNPEEKYYNKKFKNKNKKQRSMSVSTPLTTPTFSSPPSVGAMESLITSSSANGFYQGDSNFTIDLNRRKKARSNSLPSFSELH